MSWTDPVRGRQWVVRADGRNDFWATLGLGEYGDTVRAAGYDINLLKTMTPHDLSAMCDIVGMLPGHKVRFLRDAPQLFREIDDTQARQRVEAAQQAAADAQYRSDLANANEMYGQCPACPHGGPHVWTESVLPGFVRCTKCDQSTLFDMVPCRRDELRNLLG